MPRDADSPGHSVTPLELFFDLVFVFAFTQVTGFLVANLSWTGQRHSPELSMKSSNREALGMVQSTNFE